MKATIDLEMFQEMKLDEKTGEIVSRSIAEMMDTPLDFIDEEDDPEWTPLLQVLNEQFIEPYIVPSSLEVPDEKDYHTMVAASEDLLKIAYDFRKNVDELHTINPKEYQERLSRFEQGNLWPLENHGPGPDEDR